MRPAPPLGSARSEQEAPGGGQRGAAWRPCSSGWQVVVALSPRSGTYRGVSRLSYSRESETLRPPCRRLPLQVSAERPPCAQGGPRRGVPANLSLRPALYPFSSWRGPALPVRKRNVPQGLTRRPERPSELVYRCFALCVGPPVPTEQTQGSGPGTGPKVGLWAGAPPQAGWLLALTPRPVPARLPPATLRDSFPRGLSPALA